MRSSRSVMNKRSVLGSIFVTVTTVGFVFVGCPTVLGQPVSNSTNSAPATSWPAHQPMPPPEQIAGPSNPCPQTGPCLQSYTPPPPPPGYTFDIQQAACGTLG